MLAAKDELFTRPSGGYTIARSVRLRGSASAYFSKTYGTSPTSRTTMTMSAWVKRGKPSDGTNYQAIFGTGSNYENVTFNTDDTIRFTGPYTAQQGVYITTQKFRDYSAWYHIVVVYDTTNATATNRMRLYVNGVQVTSFSTQTTSNQNNTTSEFLVSGGVSAIGETGSSNYFDGYLAEINVIDGQALTPSSFGTTNSITGVWQPAKYTGTYGTNGFYLNFSDNSAVTTSSNVGIGKDFSGNGNYWTSNNINVTAYSGSPPNNVNYDSMVDSPTVGSLSSNYAVMNPLDQSGGSVSKGNLRYDYNTTSSYARGTIAIQSGKWYFECTASSVAAGGCDIGLAGQSMVLTGTSSRLQYRQDGSKVVDASVTSYGASYTSADVIGIAVDFDTNSITFYKNNTSQGAISYTPAMPMCPSSYLASGSAHDWNFGQRPFSYTPPTGFVALNTYNLPASTAPIPNGAKHMAATLYTGTGTNPRTFTGLAFQPDWIWNKSRSNSGYGATWDSVRGGTKALQTYSASSETTIGTAGGTISSFNSDGATFANGSVNDSWFNTSAVTYVSWQWKGGGTAVSNTDGSVTSSVSANTTAGFSVVTYTGTGANATVGHGLNAVPKMVIVKCRSVGIDWNVYHVSQNANPASGALTLDSTAGFASDNTYWNGPTGTFSSTLFSIGTGAANNAITATYVAYCFAAVAGYSAFGKYTGNNDNDGPFVYLGFRPRWVMFKDSSTNGVWMIMDSSRETYNVEQNGLAPNNANPESTYSGYPQVDFLSNGFKIRANNANAYWNNISGNTYIYAAFAENPFQNALAR